MERSVKYSRTKNALNCGAFLFVAFCLTIPGAAGQAVPDDIATGYLIGVGDVLDIRVYNRPQLSREAVRVDGRGMIRMPLIETDIRAACRTDSELAQEITTLFLEYLRAPHVEVFIKDFQSKPVAVIGAVRDPKRFQLQRKIRLLELLSFAGGPTEEAGGRIQIKHDPTVRSCGNRVEGRHDEMKPDNGESNVTSDATVSWFELKDLLRNDGDPGNPFVRPGDIVNVLEADRVYVVGNVFRPTVISLKDRVTLTQAIAMAGGTLPDTNLDKIRLIRQPSGSATRVEEIVDLVAINKRKADDPALNANDIIEVPSSSGKKFLRSLINSVVPTVSRLPIGIIN